MAAGHLRLVAGLGAVALVDGAGAACSHEAGGISTSIRTSTSVSISISNRSGDNISISMRAGDCIRISTSSSSSKSSTWQQIMQPTRKRPPHSTQFLGPADQHLHDGIGVFPTAQRNLHPQPAPSVGKKERKSCTFGRESRQGMVCR